MKQKSLPSLLKRYRPGPGALVAAAFIGPGTVTTCSMAGAGFGFALLWGLVFSVGATLVLQEMAARLGIVAGMGLGEALRLHFHKPVLRLITIVLVISAITIGNAAFETGNILGAAMGLSLIGLPADGLDAAGAGLGSFTTWKNVFVLAIGGLAFVLLFTGSYKLIEKAMIALVITMSMAFLSTAVIARPPMGELAQGLFRFHVPQGSLMTLLALIGTTVVPYNLFLYASAVQQRFTRPEQLGEARLDMYVSVILGGIVSLAIVITAAMAFRHEFTGLSSAAELAVQLEPLLGKWSALFIGAGLFAAGITSAITAPLAAAWATSGILGWGKDMRAWRFRLVWMFILAAGMGFSLTGFRPVQVIMLAQTANGILLPVIAIYLLWVMNSKRVMGDRKNKLISNILGIIVVIITLLLGLRLIAYSF